MMANPPKLGVMPLPLPLPLLSIQQRDRIVAFLRCHGAVTLQQFAQAMDAAVSTLRRDLNALEAEGLLERTQGTALLRQPQRSTCEPAHDAAPELSPREKRALAQSLGTSRLVRIHALGGVLRASSNTRTGEEAHAVASRICADELPMGTHAVTDGLLFETDPEVAAVKRKLLQAASSCCLLVDSTKFRPRAFMHVCGLAERHMVIADPALTPVDAKAVRSHGVHLTQVAAA